MTAVFGMLIIAISVFAGYYPGLEAPTLLRPLIAVFGGALGASLISFQGDIGKLPGLILKAFGASEKSGLAKEADILREIAGIAKAKGIWALELYLEEFPETESSMTRGIMLLMDGVSAKQIEEGMNAEAKTVEKARLYDIGMLESAGGYCLTMGITTAIIELLRANPPSEAGIVVSAPALAAVLTGLSLSRLILGPIAGKLRADLKYFGICREMRARALASLQESPGSSGIDDIVVPYLEAAGIKNAHT